MNLNMNSVETLVAQIHGLSGSISDINQLHSLLKQSEDLFQSESTRLAPLLTELDPFMHSLGYLYILYIPILVSRIIFLMSIMFYIFNLGICVQWKILVICFW